MEDNEKEQCKEAADVVVDALIDAGIIHKEDLERAAEIAEEELITRKVIRKL